MQSASSTLPGDQRELIEQAYFLGLTQSELAERHTCDRRMNAGGFLHTDAHTDHGELWTEEGCRVILVTPPEPFMIAGGTLSTDTP